MMTYNIIVISTSSPIALVRDPGAQRHRFRRSTRFNIGQSCRPTSSPRPQTPPLQQWTARPGWADEGHPSTFGTGGTASTRACPDMPCRGALHACDVGRASVGDPVVAVGEASIRSESWRRGARPHAQELRQMQIDRMVHSRDGVLQRSLEVDALRYLPAFNLTLSSSTCRTTTSISVRS